MINNRSDELIRILTLQKHPEGGYFKESYRSEGILLPNEEKEDFPNGRNYGTGIYFLLEGNSFSAFHKIKSDEIWHFYEGFPLEIISINSEGEVESQILGNELQHGHVFQYVVKAGSWFGSRLYQNNSYALVGCTVAPGFDFKDFEMAEREHLLKLFPQHYELISSLTR